MRAPIPPQDGHHSANRHRHSCSLFIHKNWPSHPAPHAVFQINIANPLENSTFLSDAIQSDSKRFQQWGARFKSLSEQASVTALVSEPPVPTFKSGLRCYPGIQQTRSTIEVAHFI